MFKLICAFIAWSDRHPAFFLTLYVTLSAALFFSLLWLVKHIKEVL